MDNANKRQILNLGVEKGYRCATKSDIKLFSAKKETRSQESLFLFG